jgi:signal transduction histidine kinase
MQRQLTCLLLLSRAPGAVPRNAVALRPLLESCMERCQPWLSGKPVIVAFDARHDAVLVTNADLAHSIIWNLLRNACQYTESGEVRITLHDTALIVADTGPGLPSSIDPRQFQRFAPGACTAARAGVVDRAAHRRAPGLDDDRAILRAGCRFCAGPAPHLTDS